MIRLIVAFAGEVEPFGMTELIANEVEVGFAAESVCNESDNKTCLLVFKVIKNY